MPSPIRRSWRITSALAISSRARTVTRPGSAGTRSDEIDDSSPRAHAISSARSSSSLAPAAFIRWASSRPTASGSPAPPEKLSLTHSLPSGSPAKPEISSESPSTRARSRPGCGSSPRAPPRRRARRAIRPGRRRPDRARGPDRPDVARPRLERERPLRRGRVGAVLQEKKKAASPLRSRRRKPRRGEDQAPSTDFPTFASRVSTLPRSSSEPTTLPPQRQQLRAPAEAGGADPGALGNLVRIRPAPPT